MDCVKCSYREAMDGSPFCEVCARGIDTILGPKHETEPPSHKPSHSNRRAVQSSRSAKSPPVGASADGGVRERMDWTISRHLEQVLPTHIVEFWRVRPDIRKIKERHPFDDVGWYDPKTHTINIDEGEVKALSSVLGCDPQSLTFVIKIHAMFHMALHSILGDDFFTIDHRLVEHIIHHMMFYLLIQPEYVEELFPSVLEAFGGLSETEAYYRMFLAVHELQPEGCRVRDRDFAVCTPTWVIDSIEIVRRYRVKDFAEWDRFVFHRDDCSSQSQSGEV